MKRKNFTTKFKAKVAIEALKGHQTVNQIAAEFDVHPSQVNAWKKQLLERAEDMFGSSPDRGKELSDEELKALHARIGQ